MKIAFGIWAAVNVSCQACGVNTQNALVKVEMTWMNFVYGLQNF